jgi:ferritin
MIYNDNRTWASFFYYFLHCAYDYNQYTFDLPRFQLDSIGTFRNPEDTGRVEWRTITTKRRQIMLSKSLQDAINEQINLELSSAYVYLSMSAHFEADNLSGFATWMRVQYNEETGHAMKFFKYMYDRGGKVFLKTIQQPSTKFKSPLDVFKLVLEHEQKVTASINKLYELALKEKDYASQSFLQWFINEQVEEEKNATDIINMLEMIGFTPISLMMADRQLGARKGS